ncbi:hypothetical protein MMC10_005736 [Thelotrema lepadinum]|nr:hypothetical protein [Thelotrema lepadinum]
MEQPEAKLAKKRVRRFPKYKVQSNLQLNNAPPRFSLPHWQEPQQLRYNIACLQHEFCLEALGIDDVEILLTHELHGSFSLLKSHNKHFLYINTSTWVPSVLVRIHEPVKLENILSALVDPDLDYKHKGIKAERVA